MARAFARCRARGKNLSPGAVLDALGGGWSPRGLASPPHGGQAGPAAGSGHGGCVWWKDAGDQPACRPAQAQAARRARAAGPGREDASPPFAGCSSRAGRACGPSGARGPARAFAPPDRPRRVRSPEATRARRLEDTASRPLAGGPGPQCAGRPFASGMATRHGRRPGHGAPFMASAVPGCAGETPGPDHRQTPAICKTAGYSP